MEGGRDQCEVRGWEREKKEDRPLTFVTPHYNYINLAQMAAAEVSTHANVCCNVNISVYDSLLPQLDCFSKTRRVPPCHVVSCVRFVSRHHS